MNKHQSSEQYTLDKNILRVEMIAELEDNWNGEGATAFPEAIISKAITYLETLEVQPAVHPTASKSIQFEYEKPNKDYLEFEVYEDRIEVFESLHTYPESEPEEREYNISDDPQEMNRIVNQFFNK